uniref:Uncharacterized protein n=1 Tax=Rhizophora mucronata TaxID=61149 RepID=A0A2P2QJP0_RHIMU
MSRGIFDLSMPKHLFDAIFKEIS